MLPHCGSFLSVLPHTLARCSDLAREHPGFLSREGSWHSNSHAARSGMPPSPTCLHNRQRPKQTPLPAVINYKPLAHTHSLFRVAAGASYKDTPSWKGGCRNANFISLVDTACFMFYPPLQILIEVADPFGTRKIYSRKCGQDQAALFLNKPSLYWLSSS